MSETDHCSDAENLVEWHLEDPKGKSLEEVRKIRDEIERKIVELPAHLQASLATSLEV